MDKQLQEQEKHAKKKTQKQLILDDEKIDEMAMLFDYNKDHLRTIMADQKK